MPTALVQRLRGGGAGLPRALLAVLVVAFVALVVVAGLAATAWSWQRGHVSDGRLLAGTVIADLDLGGLTEADAAAQVHEVAQTRLQIPLEIVHQDLSWTRTPAELGATTDAEELIAAAVQATTSSSILDAVRVRWMNGGAFISDLTITIPQAALTGLVAELADEIDGDPRDAALRWRDGEVVVRADRDGYRTDRGAAADVVQQGLSSGAGTVTLPVEVLEPELRRAAVDAIHELARQAVDAALDRSVAVTHDGREWATTPRQLGAQPRLGALQSELLALDGTATSASNGRVAPASFELPDGAAEGFVATVADEVDIAARDASLDYSSGWVEIRGSAPGQAVDRAAAAEALQAAVHGDGAPVTLHVEPTQPSVTESSFSTVLLVRQNDRKLYLYRGGEIEREWSVAVGTAGHDTPTGLFTVGARRHLPTWHNPSPNGWGRDMPERIDPGPDNPLGLRALNWNRNGADTLIRFHGTPNRASIGEAASKGCVRMLNEDVVELFDLVETGTPIVSIHG